MNACRDKIRRLVTSAIARVTEQMSQPTLDTSDLFATKRIGFLTETLEIFEAPADEWDRVAELIMSIANRFSITYYWESLRVLMPYVSIEMSELLLKLFVRHGELSLARGIARDRMQRLLTPEETIVMAVFHQRNGTSSESQMWDDLKKLARHNAPKVEELRLEVKKAEDDPLAGLY